MLRRTGLGAGLYGWVSLGAIVLIVAGVIMRGNVGLVVGIVGGVALSVTILYEIRREQSAFERVKRRVEDPQPWPKPTNAEHRGWDPYEDDRLSGALGSCRVRIAMSANGARIEAELAHWPVELAAERARGEPSDATGDEAFDRCVRLDAADEHWRPLLTSELRARLMTLIESGGAISRAGTFSVELLAPEELERTVDALARFAQLVTPLPKIPANASSSSRRPSRSPRCVAATIAGSSSTSGTRRGCSARPPRMTTRRSPRGGASSCRPTPARSGDRQLISTSCALQPAISRLRSFGFAARRRSMPSAFSTSSMAQ